jgi:NTE family protein
VNTRSASTPGKHRRFDHTILLLQGGGALGAYHAGVYEGLAEAGHAPTWVVGVSIGAITAALIAGNPPERRVQRLRAFWEQVSSYAPLSYPAWMDPMRSALNLISAGTVMAFGSPGFFVPRVPPPFFVAGGTPESTSFYDTAPLKQTLEELVDFDLINRGDVRVSLGAVNVRTGESVYFDNQRMRLAPEHVMASGALPPGFPAVEIGGEYYWDGGIVSNTPLTYVVDQKPLTTALMVQVDLFKASGGLPSNLDEVLERQKDIQYASKQRFNAARVRELSDLRSSLKRVLERLPASSKNEDTRKLAALCDDRSWLIARLTNDRLAHVSQTKDYEFSRATVDEHWASGLQDAARTVGEGEWSQALDLGAGIRLYDAYENQNVTAPSEKP